jgi:A/G-specific adenine glycosylase
VLNKNFFVTWYKNYGRDFPWRYEEISPFRSMVTEMLLRQTRAEGVAKLWDKFFEKYPDAETLALADRHKLMRQVAILGFGNQRAEALTHASKHLIEFHGGQVPNTLDELLEVSHIGNYAARAILCFAFNYPVEIVDVNILRFFSRYYGLKVKPDIRRNPGIWDLAHEALPRGRKRVQQHNYGMLDFTAEICKSGRPRCEICPLSSSCAWGIIQTATSPALAL